MPIAIGSAVVQGRPEHVFDKHNISSRLITLSMTSSDVKHEVVAGAASHAFANAKYHGNMAWHAMAYLIDNRSPGKLHFPVVIRQVSYCWVACSNSVGRSNPQIGSCIPSSQGHIC